MGISLDTIDQAVHSIKIEPGASPIDVGGSIVALDAGTLAALENITVSATDLDIRDLVFATDKVDASGSEVSLDAATLAALENITVSATDLDIRDLVFATDKVDVSGSSITTSPGGFASWKVSVASATVAESELVSTPLAGRLRINIQNRGSQSVFLRDATGVTPANGVELPSKSSLEWDLDDGANIFAITASSTADLRISEFAA